MILLALENVVRNFGIKPLLEGINFGIEERDRVGLIGANGSGKSTLIRIIAGQEPLDSGRVMFAGNPVVGYLPQNPPFNPELSVLDTIFASTNETMRLLHDYEAACHELAAHGGDDEALLTRIADLGTRLESSGGWDLETNARTVLDRLGITDTDALMGELSGGQRRRVALAHSLIESPDLLILDEPTNHLDADTVAWLETWLTRYNGALLLVTHDRYFLDRVTNRIVELDGGKAQSYAGNYGYYLEKKEEQEERQAVEEHKRKMLVRQELAWLRRGAKARTTKQKARIDRATTLMSAPREAPREEFDVAIGSRRLGSRVIEMKKVSKGYDGVTLITDFNYIVQPGEKIGIVGPNGTGKTTLLEMIVGHTPPDNGRIEVGQTVVIGYYDQESRALDDEMRVIDYIREIAEVITLADGSTVSASQMLERFLFPASAQYATIAKLSGGERRRLYLLRILMGRPNVLVLDEPTNDLDIPTLTALEDWLDGFDGSLIVVSHDRYFLDRTIDHILRFDEDGIIRDYPGTYSEVMNIWTDRKQNAEREERERGKKVQATEEQASTAKSSEAAAEAPRKLSYKEQKELQRLESAIEQAESRKKRIEEGIVAAGADYVAVAPLVEELRQLNEQLDRDVERWSELAG
jgi:ATP-binding cassette subfamily F protein uup